MARGVEEGLLSARGEEASQPRSHRAYGYLAVCGLAAMVLFIALASPRSLWQQGSPAAFYSDGEYGLSGSGDQALWEPATQQILSSSEEIAAPPSYGQAGGINYMPSTQSGVSDVDQSPDVPESFLQEETASKRRMKRLMKALKKSAKMSEKLDEQEKELSEYVKSTVSGVKDEVVELNTKETDDISAAYHLVQGPEGPPGLPGMNGMPGSNGADGAPGPPGPKGPQGFSGPTGKSGIEGLRGESGPRGLTGVTGITGISGPMGPDGIQGDAPLSNSWKPGRYFCPSGGNHYTRLVDCDYSSCRLETQYNGVWGTVCGVGFTAVTADLVCRNIGFEEGGKLLRKGGGKGPIWLSRVACKGTEEDMGDCPKTCGGAGCTHQDDVGLCCWGINDQFQGMRVNVRSSFKTVKRLREECYTPDVCLPSTDKNQVVLGGSCSGDPNTDPEWKQVLPEGEWACMANGECDNDQDMCALQGCKLAANQLSSMYIPEKLSVTLYDQRYFEGNKITYVGPRKVECLYWEGWNDRAQSLKIKAATKRPRSSWTVRVYQSSGQILNVPSMLALKYLGSTTFPYINFQGTQTFRKYFAGTPGSQFAVDIFGNILVRTGGTYDFCTASSDGSQLFVEDNLVVDNNGLHGSREICKPFYVSKGLVRIRIKAFLNYGDFILHAFWRGADTLGNKMLLRSEDAEANLPDKPPASDWALRMFRSSRPLQAIPDSPMVTLVGSAKDIEVVSFDSLEWLRTVVPETPSSDYSWIFYGSLYVEFAGTYSLCTTSDDGSRLLLDGDLLVENNGLHGAVRACGSAHLSVGSHSVTVEGFQAGGGVYQSITYSGPDTGGGEILMRSVGSSAGKLPDLPPPSSFTIRMYQAETEELTYTPDLAFLNFVQDGKTAFIDFHDLEDFRSAVPKTPSYNYVWAIYGNLDVQKAGTYTFCTISDDGSLMYVDGRLVVNNDGLHGAQERCGDISLSAGTHAMFLPGFQHYGAAYMSAHYIGPDTGRVKRYLRSDSSKAPDPPKPSAWTLRMFKGSGIQNMAQANWPFLTFIGEKTVKDIFVPNNQEFMRIIPGMPDNNFVWVYYGTVAISAPGVYSFCSTSDDGSYLFVDDSLLVDNDGLHGGERKCGSLKLAPGNHAVRIEGFNHYGGAYQSASYSGPDTRDQYRHMVSLPTAAPALPPPSEWTMRMYRTNYEPFELVPDVSHMTYVGEAVISYIAFSTLQELRNWIPGTPEAKYAWQVYGKVRIMIPGTYSFCSQSDDGSLVYFGSDLVVNNDGLHGADKRCGSISLQAGDHDVVVVGFQNYGGVYQVFSYSGPDTRGVERWTPSVSAAAPSNTAGKAGQFGVWPPETPYTPGPGAWPKGYCNPLDQTCQNLGVTDNLCGTCTAISGGGFKLYSEHGLRFAGASFDDNEIGKGSYQAQNICMLAKYGNGGTITEYASDECEGISNYNVGGQVHWYGNCYKNGNEAHCCTNAAPLQSGFDWTKFSKGNSCGGDGDTDYVLAEVRCHFLPAGVKPGPWPNGMCFPLDNTCKQLGVTDNLCGQCQALSGGFRLVNSIGLRFNGASFDDNEIGQGSNQARNICMLAKYGNGGTITQVATANSAGFSNYAVGGQVHWFGNCGFSSSYAHCCTNAALVKSGFDWNQFAKGNSCSGDGDTDYVLEKVDCYF